METKTAVFAAKKDDPIKKGAVDGMAELMEGDENFVYPDLKHLSFDEKLKMLEDSQNATD